MTKEVQFKTLALLTMSLLTACGGGGGGGSSGSSPVTPPEKPTPVITGTGSAPSTGPGDAMNYFPMDIGDQWFFLQSVSDQQQSDTYLTISTTGTKSVLNTQATVFARDSGGGGIPESYYASSGGGITFLGNSDSSDPTTNSIVPSVQLLFPVQTGIQSSISAKNAPGGKDDRGNDITIDFTQTVTNQSFETVVTPAGTFTNALKQVTQLDGTAHSGEQSVSVSGTDTSWFAPGTGIVKETETISANGAVQSTSELAMSGFEVQGQRHGMFPVVASIPGLTSLISPDASDQPASPQAVASNGSSVLVVAQTLAGSTATGTHGWTGALLASDGTPSKAITVAAPTANLAFGTGGRQAVAASDGTDFLVVYMEDDANSATPILLKSVRVSAAGEVTANSTPIATASINSNGIGHLALAYGGNRYLLVYTPAAGSLTQLSGLLIDATTGLPAAAPFSIAADPDEYGEFALGFGGGEFLLAWQALGEPGSNHVAGLYATRIATDGTVLDTPALALQKYDACCAAASPAIAFDGSNFLVAYLDARTGPDPSQTDPVTATRISTSGIVLDAPPASAGIAVTSTSAASSEANSIAVGFLDGEYWLAYRENTGRLKGVRMSTAGAVVSPGTDGFFITVRTPMASVALLPAIASTGSTLLLTWRSSTQGDIQATPIYPSVH